jgi:ketosteroid isomerase-like protein
MAAAYDHKTIEDLVIRFTDAFNKNDLDAVMAMMTDDACYDEFNEHRSHGKAEIRAAFEPQFKGTYGKILFHPEDIIVDVEAGKAMVRWLCTLEGPEGMRGWRGLDILHFEGERVKVKHTYAKAAVPLLKPLP